MLIDALEHAVSDGLADGDALVVRVAAAALAQFARGLAPPAKDALPIGI